MPMDALPQRQCKLSRSIESCSHRKLFQRFRRELLLTASKWSSRLSLHQVLQQVEDIRVQEFARLVWIYRKKHEHARIRIEPFSPLHRIPPIIAFRRSFQASTLAFVDNNLATTPQFRRVN